jgi:hypothetical protein
MLWVCGSLNTFNGIFITQQHYYWRTKISQSGLSFYSRWICMDLVYEVVQMIIQRRCTPLSLWCLSAQIRVTNEENYFDIRYSSTLFYFIFKAFDFTCYLLLLEMNGSANVGWWKPKLLGNWPAAYYVYWSLLEMKEFTYECYII